MKKRIFAGLLTLVMVFTLLPVSALAAGVTVPVTVNEGRGTDYGGVNEHTVTLNKGKPTTAYVGMTKRIPYQSFPISPEAGSYCQSTITMATTIPLRIMWWMLTTV